MNPMDQYPLSDEAIITRVLGGDREAFGLLVGRYNQRLFRVARSILNNKADAEDAVQQGYLQAFSHLYQFRGLSPFSTWLTRIVIREATARLAHAKRTMPSADHPVDGVGAAEKSPADWTEHQEAKNALEHAIDNLGDGYRSVFVMREIQGLSISETAASLQVSEDAVKVRLHRAKDHLRTQLAESLGTHQPGAFVFLGEDCRRLYARVMAEVFAAEIAAWTPAAPVPEIFQAFL